MTDTAQSQAPHPVRERTVRLNPTFFKALRGVWLFTWRSQATWRRLSLAALGWLALPVLVYLTTSSPRDWVESHRPQRRDPAVYLRGFSRRLSRAGIPLRPDQNDELLRIFSDEFSRPDADWRENDSPEANAERQAREETARRERIRQRAQTVLGERQFALFQTYQRRDRAERQRPGIMLGWNRTAPFYHWLIDVYFFIVVPLNCVRMCGPLIRDELEADTLSFLTTRPLSRARLLLVKFLSQSAWLQIAMLGQALLLFIVGAVRQIPDLGRLIPLFLGAQGLAVLAWSALGVLLGQLSKRYMALALLYGLIVEMGIGRIPTNINTLSLMRHLKTLLGHNSALHGLYEWPVSGTGVPVGALVLGAALFLALAALLFTFKEYHHTTEMQK
jgi:ABC-2 family transporter protein